MTEYDPKRLKVATEYIRRMADGRNPVTNRPDPENEVLNNVNVVRCLHFVQEVLEDVQENGSAVGIRRKKGESSRVLPRQYAADAFPYQVLEQFHYREDLQISYLLKQIMELVPEEDRSGLKVSAKVLTDWLSEEGFLHKEHMPDLGKEVTMPTRKGQSIGIYAQKVSMPNNEYYRILYRKEAQFFLVQHFQEILRKAAEKAQKRREERREERQKLKQRGEGAGISRSSSDLGAVRLIDKILEDPGNTAGIVRSWKE